MPFSRDAIEEKLEHWPVARLATTGDDGRPHQVPIVFARAGERLWSPVDGKKKSGGELVRVRNLLARPMASLLLDAYDSDWTQLWWIRIEVVAEILRPARVADFATAAALAALKSKYPQYRSVPMLGSDETLIAFDPGRIVSWKAID
jgi:PPOX class probable F420-dependent enzyme